MKDALIYVVRLFQFLKVSKSVKAKSGKSKSEVASLSGGNFQELCRQFSLAEMKAATNNFHEDRNVGHDRFGPVYKGFIDNGTKVVTVKRWSETSFQGIYEFKNEIELLYQLRHPNIVSLVGFCADETEMMVVYEYPNNLSLYDHVHGWLKAGRDPLSWEQRLRICIDVACALHHLHAGVKYAIIHRGVKSANILLDENWTAKICDFGLSKLGPLSMSKTLIRMYSRVMGTYGYADPEYMVTGQLTEKSDVYSFGAVLVEVLCARKVVDTRRGLDECQLLEWAHKCIENGSINSIIDPYLEGRIVPESFQKFVEIAYDCTRVEGKDRPSMGEVEVTLELALELQEKAHSHSYSY